MSKPINRSQFVDYCLRQLGSPVIQINIDDDQVSDRIDDALELWREYHYDATSHEFFLYQLTQDDLNNSYIPITDDVIGIISLAVPNTSSTSWMTNLGQLTIGTHWNINFGAGIGAGGCGILGDYHTAMDHLANVDEMFVNTPQWSYHQYMNRLVIHDDLSTLGAVDDYVMLEIFRSIDESTFGRIWTDRWLGQYATAIIGRQWGVNLSKYDGVQLPGGITLDGDKIYSRYNEEALRLEEELDVKYTLPPTFMVG